MSGVAAPGRARAAAGGLLAAVIAAAWLGAAATASASAPAPVGRPPAAAPASRASAAAAVPSLPQYVDVTVAAGIDFTYTNGATGHKHMPECMGSGAALFDYDGDGFLDLYILNGAYLSDAPAGPPPRNAMYRNRGDGTFEQTTERTRTGDTGYGMGAAVGDADGDGDADLYVTNFGANVFYRNDGDGTFTDVTAATGTGDTGWGASAAFVDYDNDGDLDLYVANYMDFKVAQNRECRQSTVRAYCGPTAYPGQSGVLYRNEGGLRFTDVTRQSGVYWTAGRQLGAVFGDYDQDGDQDLFIPNDRTPNCLFQNRGDGTFTEIGAVAGVAYSEDGLAESAMGADWGDYDNDGLPDIIVATFQWLPNRLYHNEGGGFFTDATFQAKVGRESLPYLGMTVAFLDYDNDGWLDLFVANGHLDENVQEYDSAARYAQKNQLFRNQADGTFAEVTDRAGPGFELEKVHHGAALGDWDNDGDTDIFVSASASPRCTLLRNDGGNRNHWLGVQAVGTRSNQDGIGARLVLTAGGSRQWREVRSTYGYLGANDLRVLFGLGAQTQADSLVVHWPSGTVQVLTDVAADRYHVVVEPAGPPRP
jgi:enediyne biosynthesis protein E4